MNKPVVTAVLGLLTGLGLALIAKVASKERTQPLTLRYVPLGVDQVVNVTHTMDFGRMVTAYEKFGTEGVYAYLVDNRIAPDSRYGDHIINNFFLPEYAKFKRRHPDKSIESIPDTTEQPQS